MDLVESGFRALIRRSVRSGLRGVWLRGAWPDGGAVLAANHHSWWDGYVVGELSWNAGQTPNVLMQAAQLARFPFFRALGALGAHELRPALGRLRAGEWLWIFPEGRLCPAGPLGEVHPGAQWLARQGRVPLVPVALRVTLRGHQHPEAYLRVGRPTHDLARDLGALLAQLDHDLRESDPERPLAGYLRLVRGAGSASERLSGPSAALGRWLERTQ